MTSKKGASLTWLLNKMAFSFTLTILGSWGLVVFHLEEIGFISRFIAGNETYAFVIELVLRTMAFLGLFMSGYYYFLLRPRLKRVAELMGDRW